MIRLAVLLYVMSGGIAAPIRYKILKKKPYFINDNYVPSEPEDWPYYECIWCNIIDEMDPGNEDKGGDDAGIVISTNIDEVFLCSKCRLVFSC